MKVASVSGLTNVGKSLKLWLISVWGKLSSLHLSGHSPHVTTLDQIISELQQNSLYQSPNKSIFICIFSCFIPPSMLSYNVFFATCHSSSSCLCLVHVSFELPTTSTLSVSPSIALFWSFNMSLCFLFFVKLSSLSHLVFLVLSCLNPVPASSDSRVTLLEEMSVCRLLTDGLFWAGCGGKQSVVMEVNVRSMGWLAGTQWTCRFWECKAAVRPAVGSETCPCDYMSIMVNGFVQIWFNWSAIAMWACWQSLSSQLVWFNLILHQ